jgi:PIN domain nuclease of toxin-antitoxin system
MRILLDTHIFLWWDNQPDQLSPQAKALCQDPTNDLVLSVASVWEMQIKQQLGKLSLRLPLNKLIEEQRQSNGLEILPVSLPHALALEVLPMHHRDPFDRMLIAQAMAENMGLLSADPMFKQYDVTLLG